MAHISRPFQVALAAVALLALVWLVALHRPSGSSSESQPSAAVSAAPKAATPSGSAATGGSSAGHGSGGVYHGSAPGVEGLTRAIAKANGAVATSQQNAKQLEEKSEQASSNSSPGAATTPAAASAPSTAAAPAHTAPGSSNAPATKSVPAASAPAGAKVAPRHASATQPAAKAAPHSANAALLVHQHLVEAELKQGKTVVLLFWSKEGSDDVAVRDSLRQLAGSDRRLAVHATAPDQVASYGSITRGVQVYGTPTLLIVAKHGRTIVLTGLQDAFAIRQAIAEARHP